jgi:hypothetical protein
MSVGLIIDQFLSKSGSKFDLNPRSKEILLGPLAAKLNVYFEGYIANLIIGAFIDNQQEESGFVISVYVLDDFDYWKEKVQESIPNSNLEVPVPFKVTSPFRIFVSESQSQIYFLDSIRNQGIILLRKTDFLDTRSYITPFRLMVSWIVDNINGEVIHASAISKDGRALVISGEKGSGKSTLALTSMIAGSEIISDDAVILINKRVYAIYTRAKIDVENIYTQSILKHSFNLKDRQDAKSIFPLLGLGRKFVLSATVQSIIVPKRSNISVLKNRQNSTCRKSFVDNSLREIFGGDEVNCARLHEIVDSYDMAILETSSNSQSNIDILFKELSNYE